MLQEWWARMTVNSRFLEAPALGFSSPATMPGVISLLLKHPLQPRVLAAPMHRHHREDEYSFVLEGRIGALLGDAVAIGNPGDLIFKPRNQWHTFWNAGDSPARILEIISPAGFEGYFRELGVELRNGAPDPQRLAALCSRYELDMDFSSIPGLIERFSVRFPL